MATNAVSKIIKLSKDETILYYDDVNEVLYMLSPYKTIYKYKDVTPSMWSVITMGDKDFLDSLLLTSPFTVVKRIPSTATLTYTLPVPTVTMYSVNSSNVAFAGYDEEKRRLYVEFNSGDVYEYYDVEPEVWSGMQKADSKGSFLHWFIKINDYRYNKVSGYVGLDYTGEPMEPNAGEPHPDGYMVFKYEISL